MKYPLIIVSLVLILLLVVPTASAFEISDIRKLDNIETYTKVGEFGKYEIRNSILGIEWLQLTKQADIELKENTASCGSNCYAIKEVTIYKDTSLVDDVRFYTIDGENRELQDIRSYQFYYKSDKEIEQDVYDYVDYGIAKNSTNGSRDIRYEIVGTEKVVVEDWIPYTKGEVMEAGTYTLKLEGSKRPDRIVDWQIKTNGIWTEEWALWGTDNSLSQGLFAYYPFDETSGTTAADSAGSNDYTTIDGHQDSNGIINYGYNMSGDALGDVSADMSEYTEFTLNIWMKRHGDVPGDKRFFAMYNWAAGGNAGWLFANEISDNYKVRLTDGGGEQTTTRTLNLDQWYMQTITISDTDSLARVYEDGVNIVNWTLQPGFLFKAKPFEIGAEGGSTNAIDNMMYDEIGIWNRSLSMAEVVTLYGGGSGLAYPLAVEGGTINLTAPLDNSAHDTPTSFNATIIVGGSATLVNASFWSDYGGSWEMDAVNNYETSGTSGTVDAYWRFNESSGNALDGSGNGNTMTNNGITYGAGMLGNAGTSGGSNEYMVATDPITLGAGNFTIAWWMKTTDASTGIIAGNQSGWLPGDTWGSSMNGGGAGKVDIQWGGGSLTSTQADLNNGSWHRVVIVREGLGAGECKLYVDGDTTPDTAGQCNKDFAPITLQLWYNSGVADYTGSLDDYQVYVGEAWTTQDIINDYAGGLGAEKSAYVAPSTNVNASFDRPFDHEMIWNVLACDSDGDCAFADANFTVEISDLRSATAILSSPEDNYNTIINTVNLQANFTGNVYNNITSVMVEVYDSGDNLDYSDTQTSSTVECYQETANVSTACGGVDTGAYRSENNYIYINYTKPSKALSATWNVKHGGFDRTNFSIDSTCFEYAGDISLRFYSMAYSGANHSSYGQCYNGSWVTITNISSAFHPTSNSNGASASRFYDGDWGTQVSFTSGLFWVYLEGWENAKIYEEAIIWNISSVTSYNTSWTTSPLTDDTYTWATFMYGDGGLNASTANRTFTIDTTDPILSIVYPANLTNFTTTTVGINYTISDTHIQTCWYSNSSGVVNNTVACGTNITGTWDQGNNDILLWANDTFGNFDIESVTFYIDSFAPNTTLVSPANNTLTNITSQNFTANLSDAGGLANTTLWIYNATGVYYNETVIFGSGVLTSSIGIVVALTDGIYSWFYNTVDTLGNDGLDASNRTITVDATAPTVTIEYPIDGQVFQLLSTEFTADVVLNFTASDVNLQACWFYNISATADQIITCGTNTTMNLTEGTHTLLAYANDSYGNQDQDSISIIINKKLAENSQVFNTSTLETKQESFDLNVSYNSSVYTSIAGNLIYNGTSYAGTESGGSGESVFSRELTTPTIATSPADNRSFYWEIGLTNATATDYANSTIQYQNVGEVIFDLCNATNNVPYINFTFIDEEPLTNINGSIDSSIWTYWLGDGSVTKPFTFINNSDDNPSYSFCASPGYVDLSQTLDMDFSFTGYPQRKYLRNSVLTNSTANVGLYLLANADGLYVTFALQNQVGTPVTSANVTVERSFLGNFTFTDYGQTDDSGTITFWLNPDYTHRLIFTKDGCSDTTYVVTPTLNSYTVTATCGGGESIDTEIYSAYIDGVKWLRSPESGWTEPGLLNFTYYVSSTISNLVAAKFELVNLSGAILTSAENLSCEADNCYASLTYNTSDGDNIKGRYYVQTTNLTGQYILLEADAYWRFIESNVSDYNTGTRFFTNFKNLFDSWGSDAICNYEAENTCSADISCKWVDFTHLGSNQDGSCIPNDERNKAEFSRFVFIFLIFVFLYSAFNKMTNFDSNNPGLVVWMLAGLIWLGSLAGGAGGQGFFYYDGLFGYSYPGIIANNYILAILVSFICWGLWESRKRRES